MSDEVKLPSEEMVERAYREGFKDGRYSSYKVGSANNADEGWPSSEARAAIEATRPTIVTGQLAEEGEDWQPIESAPQDGRRVVVWAKHYNAPCSAEHNGVRGWCVMGMPLVIQPTHWQPLPAPPTQPGPSK